MLAERPTWIEIDLDALAHNYALVRSHVGPDVHIIPALKGNAYGHGIEAIAPTLAECGVHSLATGSVEDAQAIRNAGVDIPILLFAGPTPEGCPTVLKHGFTPTIYNRASAEAVSAWAEWPTDVYVKVDIGQRRLGVAVEEAVAFLSDVMQLPHVRVAGVYTHVTFHGRPEMEWARERLAAFDVLLGELASAGLEIPVTQALASTGILAGLTSQANTVCPGSMLYGMCSIDPELCDFSEYKTVLAGIKSRLIHIREDAAGRYGVVPMGVADGFRRMPQGINADVLINGQRAPLAGTSLEYTNIDLTGIANAKLGDEVVFVGQSGDERITLTDLGAHWGTGELHTLMSFAAHLPRVAV